MTGDVRCWWCGTEPVDVLELYSFGSAALIRRPTWPPSGHRHAVTPPTPEELVADGHRIFRHIMEDA